MKKPIKHVSRTPIKFLTLTLLCNMLFLASCKSQDKAMATNEAKGMEAVLEDGYYPVEEKQALVIESEKSLKSFFSKVNRSRKPGLPVPKVDFTKEVALVVCVGAYQSEGYPKLMQPKNDGVYHIVGAQTTDNQENTAVSYPLMVYKVPRTEDKFEFVWELNPAKINN
ncbi:MAG: hypothetical protein AAGD88_08515 [Bacteroidota bacterium]